MDEGRAAERRSGVEPPDGALPAEPEPVDAPSLWQGLVEGRWCLQDSFQEGGRRCFVARRNGPERVPSSALSPAEREVTLHALRGCANKVIAGALRLADSTVATHLAAAMRKLGVTTRTELVVLLGALAPEEVLRCPGWCRPPAGLR